MNCVTCVKGYDDAKRNVAEISLCYDTKIQSDSCVYCLAKATFFIFIFKPPFYVLLFFVAGSVQRPHAQKYLKMRACRFRPQHQNKLGNEFSLFTNYNPKERLGGWKCDEDDVEQVLWWPSIRTFIVSKQCLLLLCPFWNQYSSSRNIWCLFLLEVWGPRRSQRPNSIPIT